MAADKRMTNYDVIKKLLGPIEPIGEANTDEKRYENLEETIDVVNKLLFDLNQAAGYVTRSEYSMRHIGNKATEFLGEIRETLSVY